MQRGVHHVDRYTRGEDDQMGGGGCGTDVDGETDPNGYHQDEFVVANDIVQYSTSACSDDMANDYEHIDGQVRYRPKPGED